MRVAALFVASTGVTVAVAASANVPVLRVAAPNGQLSLMIASLHVPVDGLLEPASSIFDGARHYAVEHEDPDLPPRAVITEWSTSLSEREVDTYLQRTSCIGLSEAAARRQLHEPTPHVANIYAYIICPLPLEPSRDSYISNIAPPALVKHPDVLEDANWVEMQRRKVPASADLSGFRWTLSHDPRVVLEAIRDALNAGDYDSVREQTLDSLGSPAAAMAFGKHMVDERNAKWLPKLRALFDDGHAVVIVGAMHFPGPTGLIAILRREGYTVDAVGWPAR
ncbi:TraB/GumN family protein [Paraburkholderia phenazinium]|uniref:TraB/GumN family protein n=1 Tax=Paraburkholderia phenazinium TaxID=60549 RepID=UPI00158BD60D|nr:TraB/GumN family protein [Paraburkholderia phenazinium]